MTSYLLLSFDDTVPVYYSTFVWLFCLFVLFDGVRSSQADLLLH